MKNVLLIAVAIWSPGFENAHTEAIALQIVEGRVA